LVERVRQAERALGPSFDSQRRSRTSSAKLLSYKDEYEVARLLTRASFREGLDQAFRPAYHRVEHGATVALAS
jgi:indolepyruvate ferredoxin oxidoreductase